MREDAGRVCKHPPERLFVWVAYDGTVCAGCTACGAVVAGEANDTREQAHD
jgi:uncharacterized membrane protein